MTAQNSLVLHAKNLVVLMFNDISYLYGKVSEMHRDRDRLLLQIDSHGLRPLTIDLPALSKLFDKSLDSGYLSAQTSFLTKKRGRGDKRPRFLGSLIEKVFHKSGELREDACIDSVIAIRQILLGFKKLELQCKENATNAAIQEFLDIERVIRRPSHSWNDMVYEWNRELCFTDQTSIRDGTGRYVVRPSKILSTRLAILHQVCDIASALLGDFSDENVTELPKHGPGVTATNGRTDWKYQFSNWHARLETEFPYTYYSMANEAMVFYGASQLSRIDLDSRLIAVPKTQKGPRLIAAEPTENQWIQQLVWRQLEERIVSTPLSDCISFRSQERNQVLALAGSTHACNATVDLSSASDRLSAWTVERIFRRNESLLRRLHACRTTAVSLRKFRGFPSRIALKKFGTMGSACTFPVQSIVYALMAIACTYQGSKVTISGMRTAARKVRVFGDDIIIPKDSLPIFLEMMAFFQLKVNHDKTFSGQSFRESCGVDAFRGYDVSPVYVKHLPKRVRISSLAVLIPLANNLFKRGYWQMSEYITNAMSVYENKIPIDGTGNDPLGLYAFSGPPPSTLCKTRWNEDLQCIEYRRVMVKPNPTIDLPNHKSSFLASLLRLERMRLSGLEELSNRSTLHSDMSHLGRTSSTTVLTDTLVPSTLRVGWTPLATTHSYVYNTYQQVVC